MIPRSRTVWRSAAAACALLLLPLAGKGDARAQVPSAMTGGVASVLARGAELRGGGRLVEAVAVFREGLARFPKDPSLHVELAVTYSWLGRIPEAVEAYRGALEHDGANLPAQLGLARMAAWSLDLRGADSAFARLALVPAARLEALLGRASIARARADYRAARRFTALALAIDPTDPGARDLLRRLDGEGRLDLRATIGVHAGDTGAAGRGVGLLQATYRFDERTTAVAAYQWETTQSRQSVPGSEPITWRQAISVRGSRVVSPTAQVAATFESGTTSVGWNRSVALETSLRRRGWPLLSTGIRPASTRMGHELLAWASAEVPVAPGISTGLSTFRGADSRGRTATSLAPHVSFDLPGRGSARASIVRGWTVGRSFDAQSLGLTLALAPGIRWTMDIERGGGASSRVQFLTGVRLAR